MATHNDATGYLLAYRDTVNEVWFHAICDHAIQSNGEPLVDSDLEKLWNYFLGTEAFSPVAAKPPQLALPTKAAAQTYHLEQLTAFRDFKRLSPSLTLDLPKKVTLIFGKNGAGKSSLCQALKVLSNPEKPKEPLTNVRSKAKVLASFGYKFKDSPSIQNWSELDGYGVQAQALKYFDSTIAIKHATGSLNPEAVVEISVFRLECFEYAKNYIKQFQQFCLTKIDATRNSTNLAITALKNRVVTSIDIATGEFASWEATNTLPMLTWISSIPAYDPATKEARTQQQQQLQQLTAAMSQEGKKSLQAEQSLLSQFASTLRLFKSTCENYSPAEVVLVTNTLQQKQAASIELGRAVFPEGTDPQLHQKLIFAANNSTQLLTAQSCPLCLQEVSQTRSVLFKSYHEFLISTLHAETDQLKARLDKLNEAYAVVYNLQKPDTLIYTPHFSPEFILGLNAALDRVDRAIREKTITDEMIEDYSQYLQIDDYIDKITERHTQITSALSLASADLDKTQAEIKRLQNAINVDIVYEAAFSIKEDAVVLCNAAISFEEAAEVVNGFNFTPRQAAVTARMKEAHTELVLNSFIPHLDNEYKRLSGSSLEQMGVKLATQGAEAIVTPKVGDSPVHRVLSEGEQKVHALAVFMCEASTTAHQVLVLDDPVTSFDYNYVSNFCERLRDYVRDNPSAQLIILTHNWDFFANLQSTFNRSGLDHCLSVQVLEDCSTVSEYVEKWDELCSQIEAYTGSPYESSSAEKEHLSGLLRRLIERITNGYVFNEQRHQYKHKGLNISTFHQFTKLVPLLPQEADKLRDLYSNLSPTEHDDIRNFYSGKSRDQFKSWYDDLIAMKAALLARKPK